MSVTEGTLVEFVSTIVQRGLGLYGQEEMAKICYDSGIALTDKNEIDWLSDKHYESVQELLVNYGHRNLPAKMTAIVLARQFQIPVPDALEPQKKKSRWRRLVRRGK